MPVCACVTSCQQGSCNGIPHSALAATSATLTFWVECVIISPLGIAIALLAGVAQAWQDQPYLGGTSTKLLVQSLSFECTRPWCSPPATYMRVK